MKRKTRKDKSFENLPGCAAEFIRLVIKKMRYRKKVRADVAAELAAHFEDELHDCKTDEEKEQKTKKIIEDFGDIKLLAALIRRAKKRCRPLWQKVLVRTFAVMTVIACYLFLCWVRLTIGTPTIRFKYVARLNQIVAGPSESENAKAYYDRAASLYIDWTGKDPNTIKAIRTLPGKLSESQISQMHQWLERNAPAFEALTTGANKPFYWPEYSSDDKWLAKEPNENAKSLQQARAKSGLLAAILEHGSVMQNTMARLGIYRKLSHAISWEIAYRAFTNETEAVIRNYLTLKKFATHLQGKGLIIEQITGISIENRAHQQLLAVLDQLNTTPEMLQKIIAQLQELDNNQNAIIDFEADELMWADYIQHCFTDDGKDSGRIIGRGLIMGGGNWKEMLTGFLFFRFPDRRQVSHTIEQYFELADQLLQKQPSQLQDAVELKQMRELPCKPLLLEISFEMPRSLAVSQWRLKTERLALVTVLAAIRYEKEKERYPENLDELLENGYLSQLPMDPYSDKPLVYRKTEDGFMLYSVGTNFTDDGGEIARDKKGKVKRYADQGDWVFWPVALN